jgi:hypothetical protein
MRRLPISRIRNENLRALKRYERLGKRIFLNALREQAKEFDPNIMVRAYVEFYENAFVDAAKREFNMIRVINRKDFIPDGFFLATWRAWIGPHVREKLGTMITNVNENTRGKIQLALSESVELGLNPFETAKYVSDIIGDPARALGIARTESTRANSMGKERSARDWAAETGVELWKLWVHGGSREPREDHLQQGREDPIRSDQKFPLGGGMDAPGDFAGGPEQTINCSCTVVYVSEDYIRRYYPNLQN